MNIIPALEGFHDIAQPSVIENIYTLCPADIFIDIHHPLFNATGRGDCLFTRRQRNCILIGCREIYFPIYKGGIARIRIIISIDIKCRTKYCYFSETSPDHKRMFLILSHIKIGFTFQCHNSALSDKTDRIKQFRTGIQMNSGSISKKDSILSSPWYNQFI